MFKLNHSEFCLRLTSSKDYLNQLKRSEGKIYEKHYFGPEIAFLLNNVHIATIPMLFYDFNYCFNPFEINLEEDEFKFQVIKTSYSEQYGGVSLLV